MSVISAKTLRDALGRLGGWTGDTNEIRRTLPLNESQHADMTERIKVFADAMQLRPAIRRVDGYTEIRLCSGDDTQVTDHDVALAARIETAFHAMDAPR